MNKSFTQKSFARSGVLNHKFLPLLLAAAGAMTAAHAEDASKHADSTATIACFGSDMALTSTRGTDDSVRLCAEVLNFSEPANVPAGRVVFLVDNQPAGPASGFALKRGQDPRTGQPAGVASASFSAANLHLSPGAHTVKASYVPATPRFSPSQSAAASNLQISTATSFAEAGTSSGPARSTPSFSGKEMKNPVPMETPEDKNRFWGSVEQNFMWFSNPASPALVVTGNPTISGPIYGGPTHLPSSPGFVGLTTVSGVLNPLTAANATGIAFGNSLDTGFHSGQQIQLGYWLDAEKTKSIEGSFFYVDSATKDFASAGAANLAIPYVNLSNGQQTALTVSQPLTTLTDTLAINTTPDVYVVLNSEIFSTATTGKAIASLSNRMWGADFKFRQELPQIGDLKEASYSLGLDYLNFFESLGIGSNTTTVKTDATVYRHELGLPNQPNIYNGSRTVTGESDNITAQNQFFAVSGGLRGKYQWGKVWVSGEGNVALGVMQESVDINGFTHSTVSNAVTPTTLRFLAGIPITVANGPTAVTTTTTNSGYGLFAQPGNSGNSTHDVLAVVPSASIKLGYDITKSVSLFAGYHIFYVSDVVRATDQINHFGLAHSSFYGQSIDVGVNVGF